MLKQRDMSALDDLNQMQRYLAEETFDDYVAGQMPRRRMLRRMLLICGSASAVWALLAACGDPTATTAPAPATAASATTARATTVASTTAAATTAAPTTAAATTAVATTAGNTTAASTTAAGTTAATGTTAAAGAATTQPPALTPGAARGPLTVAATDPAIEATDVSFDSDTKVMGYLVKPKGATGPFPGVIVIHENRGLTDHIKDVARRLAKAGYIALAPDLLSRQGGSSKVTFDQAAGILGQAKPEDLVKDLKAAVDFLGKQSDLKAGKLGVVGFCFGGGYTLRLAAANPKIVAAVPYYGPVPTPVTIMATTNAAILGQYGALDQRVNVGIPDLEKVMKDNNKTYEKRILDGANHAFNNDTGASYNEAAAVAAWKDTLGWFDKYLKS